jgi:UDP-N-acetylmuramoyl-tripeptide--D-alanyl-D-alanine ligase (EC 6.3.2.10)
MTAPELAESAEAMARLSTLAAVTGGRVLGADASFLAVSIDTRTLKPGDLFIALAGERFDGHDYTRRAVSLGAAGVVVGRPLEGLPAQVIVDDTLAALAALAAYWRGRFDLPLVAVAGSNGKTTTKQMLATVLGARGPVLATAGNYNNHIGVPLTLLRCATRTRPRWSNSAPTIPARSRRWRQWPGRRSASSPPRARIICRASAASRLRRAPTASCSPPCPKTVSRC